MNGLLVKFDRDPEVVSHPDWNHTALTSVMGASEYVRWIEQVVTPRRLRLWHIAPHQQLVFGPRDELILGADEHDGLQGLSLTDLFAVCTHLLITGALAISARTPRQIWTGAGPTPQPLTEGQS